MTLRDIEARLASQVEDALLDRLGYREVGVWLPGEAQPLDPPPKVAELTQGQIDRKFGEGSLKNLQGPHRPMVVWEVGIPRVWEPDQVRVEGVWHVQPQGEAKIACYPLAMHRGDARWTVYLTPQRR